MIPALDPHPMACQIALPLHSKWAGYFTTWNSITYISAYDIHPSVTVFMQGNEDTSGDPIQVGPLQPPSSQPGATPALNSLA